LRNVATLAAALSLVVAPAYADKPASVLTNVERVTVTAIPIDFDRDNPRRKELASSSGAAASISSASRLSSADTLGSLLIRQVSRCLPSLALIDGDTSKGTESPSSVTIASFVIPSAGRSSGRPQARCRFRLAPSG
jgi:hypothetical protein